MDEVKQEKNFINDSLLGFTAYDQDVMLFDFGNVIVRRDYRDVESVRIISGGGSGNEPAYVGFVGKGMLTAAVQGDVFQSPNPKTILRTIKELSLDHTAGVLIIVQGNSGTLLNFGLAVERAVKERLRVKIIAVADDFNNPNYSKTRKRGSTGVLFAIKLAGAMAEAGHTLVEINVACTEAAQHMCSISAGFKHLSIFDDHCVCHKKISESEIEVGVGINEEPGVKRLKLSSSSDKLDILVKECLSIYNQKFKAETQQLSRLDVLVSAEVQAEIKHPVPIALLVNNINGLSKMDELNFIKELVSALTADGVKIARLYMGNFFSSPTIMGLTVTILELADLKIVDYLDAPCKASVWKPVSQSVDITLENIMPGKLVKRVDRFSPKMRGPRLTGRQTNIFRIGVQFACDALVSCEKQINIIDSELGDGDTGTRLKHVCNIILSRIRDNKITLDCPAAFFDSLSKLFEATLGGTLSCIYCMLFEAASNYFAQLPENEAISSQIWLNALVATCNALKRYGMVELGDNTMYDSFELCAQTVKENMENNVELLDAFGLGVYAAQEASVKVKPPECKYPDSGAHSVGVWMRAAYEGVKLTTPTI